MDWWYITWENYGPEDNSWEPDEYVRDTGADAILEFLSNRNQRSTGNDEDTEYSSTAVSLRHDFFFPSDEESFYSSDSEYSLPSPSEKD
jgi:hypothetical protein